MGSDKPSIDNLLLFDAALTQSIFSPIFTTHTQ